MITDRIESMYNHTGEAYAMVEEKGGNVLNPIAHNLPDEFQEVEYIICKNGAYIITPLIVNEKTNLKFKVSFLTGVGCRNGTSYFNIFTNVNRIGITGVNSTTIFDAEFNTNQYLVELLAEENKLILNKTTEITYDFKTFFKDKTARFGIGKRSDADYHEGEEKIYDLSGFDGNTKINFIPCYIKSTKEVGMYDLVSGTFFGNQGTGAFTYGTEIPKYIAKNLENLSQAISTIDTHTEELEDMRALMQKPTLNVFSNVMSDTAYTEFKDALKDYSSAFMKYMEYNSNEEVGTNEVKLENALSTNALSVSIKGNNVQEPILPSGYTQVDYIQSDGNQYIDTGIVGNINTKIETKVKTSQEFGELSGVGAFGRYDSTTNSISVTMGARTSNQRFGNKVVTRAWNASTDYKIKIDKTELNVDGTAFSLNATDTFTTNGNLLLGWTGSSTISKFSGNIYYYKSYNNNILSRDMIPCFRNSDNAVGMYDLVSQTFFENQGTGAFTYGSVVTTPNPDYPQEIKTLSEGKVVVSQKNLFFNNQEHFPSNVGNVPLIFKSSGGIEYKGTPTATWKRYNTSGNVYGLEANKEYTLCQVAFGDKIKVFYVSIYFYDSKGNTYKNVMCQVNSTNQIECVPFTLTEAEISKLATTSIVVEGVKKDTEYDMITYPLLLEGTYTTNDLLLERIDLPLHSKNLFDNEFRQGSWNTLTLSSRVMNKNDLFLKSNNKYKFYTNLDLTKYLYSVVVNDKAFPVSQMNPIINTEWNPIDEFVLSKDGYFGLIVAKIDKSSDLTPEELTPFTFKLVRCENLTSQDTLNIGYDGNTHIEKKWGKLILNGSEGSWYLSGTHCKKNTFKDLGITNILTPATNSIVGNAICNTFTLTSATNIYNGNSIIGFGIGTDGLYFNYNDMTVNDFKAFLKSKYDAGNPVVVYYKKATSEIVELENTQIPLLPDTNNISVESNVEPTELKVKYAIDIFSEQPQLVSEVADDE